MASEIQWPTHVFGYPQMQGYGYRDQDNRNRTDVESGPAHIRQKFRQVPSDFSISILMPTAVFGVFEAWYKLKLNDGTAWFDGPIETGEGLAIHTIRFKEQYQAQRHGPCRYIVTATWEAERRPGLTEEELDALIEKYDHDALEAMTDFNDITDALGLFWSTGG